MSGSETDARVKAHYEALPYPERDPADEAERLVEGSPSMLAEVIHCVFAGRRTLNAPLRVLAAGGGTGDGTIMLAQHMADAGNPGTVDYLDVSEAARRVCEARAAARGLSNIRFHTGSLLDLPTMGFEPFDYIDCCGVLHHLDDPAAGLRALTAVLKPDGGMGLMVYAPYGRDGVYPMQGLLRSLAPEPLAPAERLAVAKDVLAALPPTNALRRNPFLGDHLDGDAGLYDLLLHSRDRAFTIAAFEALLADAGLAVAAMAEAVRYDPRTYVSDPGVLARLAALDAADRRAACEVLAGNMRKHVLYAVPAARAAGASADAADPDRVPVPVGFDATAMARAFKPGQAMTATYDGIKVRRPLPDGAGAVLGALDGKRTAAEIAARSGVSETETAAVLGALIDLGKVRLTDGAG